MICGFSLVTGNTELNSLVALEANTNHAGDNSNEGSSIAQTESDAAEADVARWKRLYAGNGIETDGLHVPNLFPLFFRFYSFFLN